MPHEEIKFAFEKLRHYPHMKPKDVLIWERFINKKVVPYDFVEYDVLVGNVPQFPDEMPDNIKHSGEVLKSRKIDVVGHASDFIDIIEVKPNAGTSALGQALSYVQWYEEKHEPAKIVRPVIVTDFIDENMARVFSSNGINVFVV